MAGSKRGWTEVIVRHRGIILTGWVALCAALLPAARNIESVLSVAARVDGSESAVIDDQLAQRFRSPFAHSVVHSHRRTAGDAGNHERSLIPRRPRDTPRRHSRFGRDVRHCRTGRIAPRRTSRAAARRHTSTRGGHATRLPAPRTSLDGRDRTQRRSTPRERRRCTGRRIARATSNAGAAARGIWRADSSAPSGSRWPAWDRHLTRIGERRRARLAALDPAAECRDDDRPRVGDRLLVVNCRSISRRNPCGSRAAPDRP